MSGRSTATVSCQRCGQSQHSPYFTGAWSPSPAPVPGEIPQPMRLASTRFTFHAEARSSSAVAAVKAVESPTRTMFTGSAGTGLGTTGGTPPGNFCGPDVLTAGTVTFGVGLGVGLGV